MKNSVWLTALLGIFVCVVNGKSLPNVIFILTDDMGNADASFNFKITNPKKAHAPPIVTPNLDFLAHNGIILKQHYSHHVCGPSRCALITSRLSHNLGNPFPMIKGGNLKSGYQTFIHELSDRGYVNHFIGKWGIDYDNRSYSMIRGKWEPPPKRDTDVGPLGRGFDTFYGMYSSGHNHFTKKIRGILDWHLFNETHLLDAPYGLDEEPDKSSTTLITRQAVDIIKNRQQNDKKPFFMHISYSMPHDPLQVEPKYLDANNFAFCHNSPSWRRRTYCGMIACVDEGIGNITKVLKDNNILDNTIIIFASDNGGFMNVGGYNYPYRGVKTTSFEGGIRTLAFIYGMHQEQRGKIFDGMFHLVDFGPTILSHVDSTQNKPFKHKMGSDIDGIDLSQTLKEFGNNNNKKLKYRTNLIAQSEGHNLNVTTYIEGNYKLILGAIQFDDVFYEPSDSWCVTPETRQWHYTLMDIGNYVLENTLGSPNFFFFEWAFTLRLHDLYDYIKYDGARVHGDVESSVFIIPTLDWNQKNAELKIKLFDLKNDASESHNLAFENKEKVTEMYEHLRLELVKTSEIVDEDLFAYVAAIFHTFANIATALLLGGPIVLLVIMCCCCRCFFSWANSRKIKKE